MSTPEYGTCAETFESMMKANGFAYWLASDLMGLLGYQDMKTFTRAINKAQAACATLGIPIDENFIRVRADGQPDDYKLSRFGCYLTVMNGDVKKPAVATAQAYFAVLAESMRQHIQEAAGVERVLLRGKVTEHEKSLAGVAKAAGVEVYAFFQNEGYRGLYNMGLKELRAYKGLEDGKPLLDYMGKTELAANLFRITQTEEKIKNEQITGQVRLENAAFTVGRKVRQTMVEISGGRPEDLPLEQNIKEVQSGIKKTHKRFKVMDKAKQIKPKSTP
jgi:DNA-damage-inducible protein D